MSATNPPVSEDTRRVMQVMTEDNLELRERAEAAERDRDRALEALRGVLERNFCDPVNECYFECSRIAEEHGRTVLAELEQARTPQEVTDD